MLNSMKTDVPEKDKNSAANAAEVMGRTAQPHDQAWARSEPTKAGTASCIGSDMSIVGNVECKGPAQVFGRIEGEVRASDLQISDGAQVEGSIIAQNVTVCGRVKGTIHAVRVKLQNGGAVEGDRQMRRSQDLCRGEARGSRVGQANAGRRHVFAQNLRRPCRGRLSDRRRQTLCGKRGARDARIGEGGRCPAALDAPGSPPPTARPDSRLLFGEARPRLLTDRRESQSLRD